MLLFWKHAARLRRQLDEAEMKVTAYRRAYNDLSERNQSHLGTARLFQDLHKSAEAELKDTARGRDWLRKENARLREKLIVKEQELAIQKRHVRDLEDAVRAEQDQWQGAEDLLIKSHARVVELERELDLADSVGRAPMLALSDDPGDTVEGNSW
jgi:DNA repair exonuclease SbcCD ATPase subunit